MKKINLLTIGNSFSNNALTYLPQLAEANGGIDLRIGRLSLGGCSLEKHWNLAQFTRQVPEHKICQLELPEGPPMNYQEALTAYRWDFVTLQQASQKSWIRSTFEPHLGGLIAEIKNYAPQAEILLHQTWAYRADSAFMVENGLTQQYMMDRIEENYEHFSRKYGLRILRSGQAIQAARTLPGRQYRWPDPDFDYVNPKPMELPNQDNSLCRGWYWWINNTPDGIPVLHNDSTHLNSEGCFLIGCLWFGLISGDDILANSFKPDDIADERAAVLRQVAHEILQ